MFLIVVIWGGNWANMKIGLNYVSPMNYLWQRLFFSTFMIAPLLLLCRNGIKWEFKTIGILVVAAASWVFSNVFMMFALGSENSGISAILTYTQPLFVFGLSAIFLKGEITKVKVVGALLGFAGIGVIYIEQLGGGGAISAIFYLVLSAFLWAVSIVGYKLVSDVVHPYWMSFTEVALGSFLVLPFALSTGGITFPTELPYVLSVGYMTVLATAVAFVLWFDLLKNEDAVTVSSSSLMVPIVAFIVGAALLGEMVNGYQVVGIVMVLTGVYFVNRKNNIKKITS